MDHAWLDSLSEDWVSQPASDASVERLPPLAVDAASRAQPLSRIPRRSQTSKPALATERDAGSVALSERSANEINISPRRPSSARARDDKASASSDEASIRSVLISSIVRRSTQGRTSSRRRSQTPEWKRRLVQGKMSYGEQRDLFSSAAVGLQDMFKPPTAGNGTIDRSETTLPSSPPLNPRIAIDADLERFIASEDDDEPNVQVIGTPSPSPRKRPREIRYTFNMDGPSPSVTDESASGPGLTSSRAWRGGRALPEDRKSSGQSVIRNEDLSPILIGKRSGQDGRVDFAPIEVPVEQLKQKLERLRASQLLQGSQQQPQSPSFTARVEADAPETTEDYGQNGGFVNMVRGGRSGDGSFYQRPLSSEMGVDSSEMLPEESLQASTPKQFPTIRTQAACPGASLRLSPATCLPQAPFPSPDKRQVDVGTTEEAKSRPAGSPLKLFGPYDTFTNQTLLRRISQFEEASRSPSRASSSPLDEQSRRLRQESDHSSRPATSRRPRAVSRFGHGQLEGFEFTGDLSIHDARVNVDKDFASPSPLSPVTPLHPPEPISPDHESDLIVGRRRKASPAPGASSSIGQNRDGDPEGKRVRTSPSKGPTPKRRRTLHRSDVAFRLQAIDSAHQQMQSAMNMSGQGQDAGLDPEPLASQHTNGGLTAPSQDMPEDAVLDASQEGREDLQAGDTKPERPRSIRTQDFVDQAAQIMAMIRSQVMPGLASVEESEAENMGVSPRPSLSDSCPESTTEPLSRPPSREGKPLPRVPHRQQDPVLLQRLRQYQERSDGAEMMVSSMQSVHIPNDAKSAPQKTEDISAISDGPMQVYGDIITDLPNVRISVAETPHGGSQGPPKEFPTNSSARSTSRTFPTTSSRGSESRRTIMPASVSHLIPDKVGSMYLDKENNIWVKRKDVQPEPVAEGPTLEDSEDDPFASIPDLSVDITKELQNLRLTSVHGGSAVHESELRRLAASPSTDRTGQQERDYVSGMRQASQMIQVVSEQQTLPRSQAPNSAALQQGADRGSTAASSRAGDGTCDSQSTTKRRNLTISFSSPIASIIYDVAAEDIDGLEDDDAEGCTGSIRSVSRLGPQPSSRGLMYRASSGRGPEFVPRPVSRIDERDEESTEEIQPDDERQVSILGETSIVSRKAADGRQRSLSFIIDHSTPNRGRVVPYHSADDSAIIGHNVGRLSLSPLSEFTVNKSDPSFGFEVSYVMGQRHMATGDGSKRVLSMTIRELVDKLGEVEPYEPYWEDMTELDLHGKQLASLHMLDEFCGRLVTLDASSNRLGHLDGIPATVRHLKASSNLLTELTSWDHLMNLQYIDISGNEVNSLSALKNLVHLRSIQADDNQLTSLDGLEGLDGLLSLRARNNAIERVDFSGTKLSRLGELDLEGNCIRDVVKLDRLSALARLSLRGNRMRALKMSGTLETLRQLDVSDNELEALDLQHMPNLRAVQADRNRINQVSGFRRARRIDSLSLREQSGDERLDLGFLNQAYEVRKLFLSGNYLGTFEPAVDFLNLQLLELANCGLQSLPERMGQMMPNLRALNINLNAVADLWPLQFLPRLKKLLVAGNRLSDATAATQLLTDFPHLRHLDVRDNPMTLGLYGPTAAADGRRRQGDEGFALADADAERDGLFASRLDEATRLRRRLHQVVLVASCRRLRKLDGLAVRRDEVLARDWLLDMLVRDGVVAGEVSTSEPRDTEGIRP
ncbi:conserved leucine-rich repeat protein [Ophiocordyceps camponoti-floridani]|uniref:Conserved leucine-rich repeat protein n=1 Tax=Ophiocordyceps camponoti-floridani TaxID=2030778 RepID=A0A8H4VEQ9_9HYPO|nr:conserved leucine-rich repeat protein [Ophiocordyceps camponoti-floridani]